MRNHIICICFLFSLFGFNAIEAQEFWEELPFPAGYDIRDIKISEEGKIYVAVVSNDNLSSDEGVFRSVDNGYSWELVLLNNGVRKIEINDEGRIYAVGTGLTDINALAFSDDQGESWCGISPPILWSGQAIKCLNTDTIFLSNWETNGSILYQYVHSLNAWDTLYINTNFSEYISEIEIHDNELYVGFIGFYPNQGGVAKSIDHGQNWNFCGLLNHQVGALSLNEGGDLFTGDLDAINNPGVYRVLVPNSDFEYVLESLEVQDIAINANGSLFISAINGIKYSIDNGETFLCFGEGHNHPIKTLEIDNDGFLYAGWNTYMIRTLNSTLVGNTTHNRNSTELFFIFPNPATNLTTFHYTLKTAGTIRIEIYKAEGTLVETIHVGRLNIGNHETRFNAATLTAGLYYCSLVADGEVMGTRKMVVMN